MSQRGGVSPLRPVTPGDVRRLVAEGRGLMAEKAALEARRGALLAEIAGIEERAKVVASRLEEASDRFAELSRVRTGGSASYPFSRRGDPRALFRQYIALAGRSPDELN